MFQAPEAASEAAKQESSECILRTWENIINHQHPIWNDLKVVHEREDGCFLGVTAYLWVSHPGTREQLGSTAPQRGSASQRRENLCGNCNIEKPRRICYIITNFILIISALNSKHFKGRSHREAPHQEWQLQNRLWSTSVIKIQPVLIFHLCLTLSCNAAIPPATKQEEHGE